MPAPSPALPNGEDVNFRFLISDDVNAIDEFDHVYITISEIGVQSGGESGNWAVFPPDITKPVDLKPLVGENALEIWSGNLAPGAYRKVFIYVSEVNGIFTTALCGGKKTIKLPSAKLHVVKPFVISENTTTSFVYDVTVIKAGKSGQYILQPQISQSGADQEIKEIKPKEGKSEKPGKPEELEFEGTIEAIEGTTWTVNIEGESRTVDVSEAEIEGEPDEGLHIKIEGIEENGIIAADEVEVEELETQEEEVALEDTIWVLEKFGDPDNLIDILDDTEIIIEFVSAKGTAKGSAGCNSHFSSYEKDGNQLSILGPMVVTAKHCVEPEGVMNQEQEYFKILKIAKTYEIEDEQLHIFGGDIFSGDKELIFELE
jgi:heat shock protein HslJ